MMSFADRLRTESLKHSAQNSENKLTGIVDVMVSKTKSECSIAAGQGRRGIVGFVNRIVDTYEGGTYYEWEKPDRLLMYIGTPKERAAARKKQEKYFANGFTLLHHWKSWPCERKGLVHDLCLQDVEWVAKSVSQNLQSEGLRAVVEIVKFPDLEYTSHSSVWGETTRIRELSSTYYNLKVSVNW